MGLGLRTLTMPVALATSGLLWPKLPLWLVETVFCLLLLSPTASMDWLRLRITRCKGKPRPSPAVAPHGAGPGTEGEAGGAQLKGTDGDLESEPRGSRLGSCPHAAGLGQALQGGTHVGAEPRGKPAPAPLTLKDSKKPPPPPPPFSILSSSPPRPIMDWLLMCSSSYSVSSSAARVRSCRGGEGSVRVPGGGSGDTGGKGLSSHGRQLGCGGQAPRSTPTLAATTCPLTLKVRERETGAASDAGSGLLEGRAVKAGASMMPPQGHGPRGQAMPGGAHLQLGELLSFVAGILRVDQLGEQELLEIGALGTRPRRG